LQNLLLDMVVRELKFKKILKRSKILKLRKSP